MSGPRVQTSSAFAFDNTYARDLPGSFAPATPEPVPSPVLLRLNEPLAEELGLDAADLKSPRGARLFSGNEVPEGAEPIAQAYAGHQFGGFSPQLGDGRALLLGEVIDRRGAPPGHRPQGIGAHALLAARRRQGGGGAGAARVPDG